MIDVFEKDEVPPELHRRPFVTMDPGDDGGVLGFHNGTQMIDLIAHALDPYGIIGVLKAAQTNIMVVERQYVTDLRRSRSVIELAWRCGIALGEVHSMLLRQKGGTVLNIVRVAPSTWQAYQRKQEGIRGREKGQGIVVARKRAAPVLQPITAYVAANEKQRDGYHAAYGIAEWWASVAWGFEI